MRKPDLRSALLIFGGALLLCYAGFSNRFPLTYPDTGTYIYSGFEGKVPDDRPLSYGLFIRHASLAESLFLVIFIQGSILSFLLFLCIKYFTAEFKTVIYCLLLLILTFFTGASVNVSQLIPDIFTPVMILSLALLATSVLTRAETIITGIIFAFALSTHTSHFLICLIILAILTIFYWRQLPVRNIYSGKLFPLISIWSLFVVSSFITPAIHFFYSGNFRTSNATHVFVMYKLNEMGILEEFLEKNCNSKHYKICDHRESIPTDFIWDYKNSPVYKTGGWEANKQEYNEIVKDVLSHPFYLKHFILKCISNSIEQFFNFSTGDAPSDNSQSPPYQAVKSFFKEDIRQFEITDQYSRRLNFIFLNNRQLMLIAVSVFLFVLILTTSSRQMIPDPLMVFMVIILLALAANAIVCGSLSQVSARYQSRVVWLFPLLVFILVINQRKEILNFVRTLFRE